MLNVGMEPFLVASIELPSWGSVILLHVLGFCVPKCAAREPLPHDKAQHPSRLHR